MSTRQTNIDLFNYKRRATVAVKGGALMMGSDYPVRVQSMTNTPTADVERTVEQVVSIANEGADIVRLTAQGKREGEALQPIMESLRNQVSVVLQNNVLFSGTILDNLRWGNMGATEEEGMEACRQACADEFIQRFPDGYNTYIEQGGTNVSGGQKQRLCIARALIKKPKILILDDSVSALDSTTENNLRKALKEQFKGTTIFMIVQKISSCREVDRVLVVDDGTIVGNGTHEELIENNEIYKEISESQKEVMPEE